MKRTTTRPGAALRDSLWFLVISPAIWGLHFLLSYITAAVYCAKFAGPHGSLEVVRWAIAGYTALAIGGIILNGWQGWHRYRLEPAGAGQSADTPQDRHRFLGFATLLLAGLSLVATLFSALVVLFFEDCR